MPELQMPTQPSRFTVSVPYKKLELGIQAKIWFLAMDANTSGVNVEFSKVIGDTLVKASVGYKYAGAFSAGVAIDRGPFKAVQGFRFGANADAVARSFRVGVYGGAKLVPYAADLDPVFRTGVTSFEHVLRTAPASVIDMGDPRLLYKTYANDGAAIANAINNANQVANAKSEKKTVGAGVTFNWGPTTGIVIRADVVIWFP